MKKYNYSNFNLRSNIDWMFNRVAAIISNLEHANFRERLIAMHPEHTVLESGEVVLVDLLGNKITLPSTEPSISVVINLNANPICISFTPDGLMAEYKDKIFGTTTPDINDPDSMSLERFFLSDKNISEEDIGNDGNLHLINIVNHIRAVMSCFYVPPAPVMLSSIELAAGINKLVDDVANISTLVNQIGQLEIDSTHQILEGETVARPYLFRGTEQPILAIDVVADYWLAVHKGGVYFGYTWLGGCRGAGRVPSDALRTTIFGEVGRNGEVISQSYIMIDPVIKEAIVNFASRVMPLVYS